MQRGRGQEPPAMQTAAGQAKNGEERTQLAWAPAAGRPHLRARTADTISSWRPADDIPGQHRPAAGHEVVLIRIVEGVPPVTLVHGYMPGTLVSAETNPPALPVLLIPLGPLPVNLSRTSRLGDVVQAGITAAPAAGPTAGQAILSQEPERRPRRRRTEPGGPRDLAAPAPAPAKSLIDQRSCAAENQEHRMSSFNPPGLQPTPPDRVGVPPGDPELVPVSAGQLAAGDQVDQRIRFSSQLAQDPGNGAVAQRAMQGQVTAAAPGHGRAGGQSRPAGRGEHPSP